MSKEPIHDRCAGLDDGPERAGVGRATVYRHWAQPDHLVYDALTDAPFPFFAELDGPLRPWLREELRWRWLVSSNGRGRARSARCLRGRLDLLSLT